MRGASLRDTRAELPKRSGYRDRVSVPDDPLRFDVELVYSSPVNRDRPCFRALPGFGSCEIIGVVGVVGIGEDIYR